MSRPPLVTVILTSYNHAAFIEECLDSVLQQSIEDIEVLFIDDASSDGTLDLVSKRRDSRLQIIRNECNRGRHLRNWALRSAKGVYVAFQNSDDIKPWRVLYCRGVAR
jgi:glycosyltransferase involved in cell wall biosynthesis